MKELLIGCGSQKVKVLSLNGKNVFENVTTLDVNPDHKPDVVHNLKKHPLPFFDNEFDEIHAYEVLEHLAQQGDFKFFFSEFSEYWRILKPGGRFFASVPSPESQWVWGDPSHSRIIHPNNLSYLCQSTYEAQVGKTQISDFRNIYKADFKIIHNNVNKDNLYFILEAIK